MDLLYFTEQPMSAYDEEAGRDFGATALMFSNKHFDPKEGSRLYNEFIEQYKLAEEVGIDGIMLNEHHNAPFLHAGQSQHLCVDPGCGHREDEDRHARQSVAAVGKPGAVGRRAGDDRHDLQRPPWSPASSVAAGRSSWRRA